MYCSNFAKSTKNRKVIGKQGVFAVIEYTKDYKPNPQFAAAEYFAVRTNMHRHQVIANITNGGVITEFEKAGIIMGEISDRVIYPIMNIKDYVFNLYSGKGIVVFNNTYRNIVFQKLTDWQDGVVIPNDYFIACSETAEIILPDKEEEDIKKTEDIEHEYNEPVEIKIPTTIELKGEGDLVLSSPIPEDELVNIELTDDKALITGYQVLAWSGSLKFNISNTETKFEGTGKILLIPT